MYEQFGAREIDRGEITFRLFFPDRDRDPAQYDGRGLPGLKEVRVIGSFQKACGQAADWDAASGVVLTERTSSPDDPALAHGRLFEQKIKVPDGFRTRPGRICSPANRSAPWATTSRSSSDAVGGAFSAASIERRLPCSPTPPTLRGS